MELEITKETYNPVLEREEIFFEVKDAKTPKREDVKKRLAALKNADESLIAVKYIRQNFGKTTCYGKAHLYKSPETLKRVEPKYIMIRGTQQGKQKAKKEQPKEEKEGKK